MIQPISLLFLIIESMTSIKATFMPFFNETNYHSNIDINLTWNENIESISLPTLRKGLRKYGLDLVEEYKILKLIVISDQKFKQ